MDIHKELEARIEGMTIAGLREYRRCIGPVEKCNWVAEYILDSGDEAIPFENAITAIAMIEATIRDLNK